MNTTFDVIVVGAGPAGMTAAIVAARRGKRVLLLEKLAGPGEKLRASGGGRCNLSNTLPSAAFMDRFGRNGRCMRPALAAFDRTALVAFLADLGVPTHAPDGFHVFPVSHDAGTVVDALLRELKRLGVELRTGQRVGRLCLAGETPGAAEGGRRVDGVVVGNTTYDCAAVVVATGGKGYPSLGGGDDGYTLAEASGHRVTPLFPAMLPLQTREAWVAQCRADTIGKATVQIDLPKLRAVEARGDLIFTADGIRGPVVLDFAREVTPLLAEHGAVPLRVNLVGGRHEDAVRDELKRAAARNANRSIGELVATLVPGPLARELCRLAGVDPDGTPKQADGPTRDRLHKVLTWTPLTVVGHGGFAAAMVTRGGVALAGIRPETLASRRVAGLFFCGEVLDLDGPCGGFNLQWAFSSGFLAGHLGIRD